MERTERGRESRTYIYMMNVQGSVRDGNGMAEFSTLGTLSLTDVAAMQRCLTLNIASRVLHIYVFWTRRVQNSELCIITWETWKNRVPSGHTLIHVTAKRERVFSNAVQGSVPDGAQAGVCGR